MESLRFLEMRGVPRTLEYFEPGTTDPISHLCAVLGSAYPIVPSLDDEGRHVDLAEPFQCARPGIRASSFDRRGLGGHGRNLAQAHKARLWWRSPEKAIDDRRNGPLAPCGCCKRIGLGQGSFWICC